MGEPGTLEAGGDAGCSRGFQKGKTGIEMGLLGVRREEVGNDKVGSGVVAHLDLKNQLCTSAFAHTLPDQTPNSTCCLSGAVQRHGYYGLLLDI